MASVEERMVEENKELVTDIIQKYELLMSDRGQWNTTLEEIRDYIYPDTRSFTEGSESGSNRGERIRVNIYDGTAERSHQDLVGNVISGLMNPGAVWFQFGSTDPNLSKDKVVQRHYEEATSAVMDILFDPDSNFYSSADNAMYECTAFGMGITNRVVRGKKVYFKHVNLADALFEENELGVVDSMYRNMLLTAGQILKMFPGLEKSNPDVYLRFKGLANNSNDRYSVLHAVFPREDRGDLIGPKGMPWASVYVLREGEQQLHESSFLDESGYESFPFYTGRWKKIHGVESLGRGVGWSALRDVRVLNKMVKTNLEAGELVVRPPLQAPRQSFQKQVNLGPNAMNYYKATAANPSPKAEPLNTVGNLPIGLEMENQRRGMIRAHFLADLLQETKTAEMTSTEVAQNKEERLVKMAPQMANIITGYLNPLLKDMYRHVVSKGIIDQPAVLKGKELSLTYNTPLVRALKNSDIVAIQRYLNGISQLAQFDPSIGKAPDVFELADEIRKTENLPASIQRDKKQVEDEILAERKAEADRQRMETVKTASEAGLNVAKIQESGVDLSGL